MITSNSGTWMVSKLVTPKLIAEAKNHFNCDSINGIYLEDEGGETSEASHFEKILFGNELMTGIQNGNPVLSRFTLALLEDSGWYWVDYGLAQDLEWGKKKGCDFYSYLCKDFKEYCS